MFIVFGSSGWSVLSILEYGWAIGRRKLGTVKTRSRPVRFSCGEWEASGMVDLA